MGLVWSDQKCENPLNCGRWGLVFKVCKDLVGVGVKWVCLRFFGGLELIICNLGGDFDGIFSGVSILLDLEKGVKK